MFLVPLFIVELMNLYVLANCPILQGYYMTKDVFGTAGDFITSPEISQMFGEVCFYIFKMCSKY